MNKATAQTRLSAARALGSAPLEVSGNVHVQVIGRAKAVTRAKPTIWAFPASRSRQLDERHPQRYPGRQCKEHGTIDHWRHAGRSFAFVRDEGYGGATATTGGAGGGRVSILGATTNGARAIVAVESYAGITNDALAVPGLITAGAVDIDALASTLSTAAAKTGYGVSVVTIGNLDAVAISYSTVKAYIQNALVETANSTSVNATSVAGANASSEAPGGIGIASGTSAKARAFVGMPAPGNLSDDDRSGLDGLLGQKPQTVSAYASAASVTAGGDITIRAYNEGYAVSNVAKGTTVSGGSISRSSIPTFSEYYTHAQVLGGSALVAAGSISITAEDLTQADSVAKGQSIGLIVNSETMCGRNFQDVVTQVDIGASLLKAREALNVLTTSRAVMDAQTVADGGGAFDGSSLYVHNTLYRNTRVSILDGAHLEADYGNLVIQATSGTRDSITTRATLSSGGVVALAKIRGYTTVSSGATVSVASGAQIVDTFNTVRIIADASMNKLSTELRATAAGLGVAPNVQSNTSVTIRPLVDIAGSAEARGHHRRYVEFRGITSKLYIYDYCYASGKAPRPNVVAHVHQIRTLMSW
jgi:hypothetical protein